MYSHSHIAVDRGVPVSVGIPTGGYYDQPDGLGFDWGSLAQGVTNLIQSATPVGLKIYQDQMQLKTVKATAGQVNPAVVNPYPGSYGASYTGLPASPAYVPQPNVGGPGFFSTPQGGMSTGAMVLIGGLVLGGIALFTMKRSS